MIAIILAVIVVIAVVAFAAKKAMFHADGTVQSIIHWTKYILVSEAPTFTCYGLNKVNAVLAGMFLCLSAVLLDTGFFVAGIMATNGTHVQGMGWILVSLYCLGTIGCIAYSVGLGSHIMNRPNR
jgi:hypothetical protein